MTFSRKIFISVFLTTLLLGSLLIWAAHSYVSNQTKEKFISRYSVFTKILAGTLTRLDSSTEALMLNAAKVIQAKDAELGLLSEPVLKDMRDDLKMTHVFVTDASGKFIRSTNESPTLIPNLFSFCSDYKKLVAGTSVVEATPVIKPHPEPKPFKFLSIPSRDRKRIIEVGVRVDFIAKTLAEGVSSDTNVLGMSLYGPDGTAFGRFDSKGVEFEHHDTVLPTDLNTVAENSDSFSFFSKVESSHPQCCQCDVAGTSRNGEYYYVLESKVSKKELKAVLATTSTAFLILGFLNGIVSLLLSRFLSRRLVRNVENAARKVQEMKDSGDLSKRIELPGDDEVSFLTQEFDRVLDDLEDSRERTIENERLQAKMQLAREVAHNIKSPLHAIEIMMPVLPNLPKRVQKVLSDSVREIKELASKLKQQSEGAVSDVSTAVIFIPILLDELVNRKRAEYSDRAGVSIALEKGDTPLFIKADPTDLKAILSNLINNAIEAAPKDCQITVANFALAEMCIIEVRDNGVGIPADLVEQIGSRRITFKGDSSRGLGLVHAFQKIESWSGKVIVESVLGMGTTVKLMLPTYKTEDTFTASKVLESSYVG